MKHFQIKTFLAITLCLTIAILFLGGRDVLDMLSDYPLNLGVGIGALFVIGFFASRRMNYLINIRRRSPILVGQIGSVLILICGILLGSTIGFIEEGFSSVNEYYKFSDAVCDYYYKPLYWILLFGGIPTFIVGGVLGYCIKQRSKT